MGKNNDSTKSILIKSMPGKCMEKKVELLGTNKVKKIGIKCCLKLT